MSVCPSKPESCVADITPIPACGIISSASVTLPHFDKSQLDKCTTSALHCERKTWLSMSLKIRKDSVIFREGRKYLQSRHFVYKGLIKQRVYTVCGFERKILRLDHSLEMKDKRWLFCKTCSSFHIIIFPIFATNFFPIIHL